jgi:putative transposase
LQQQEDLDEFLREYNEERPHEALAMKTPNEVYCSSQKEFEPNPEELSYPQADEVERVSLCGEIAFNGRRVYVSRSFAGYNVGITRQDEDIYLVKFMDYELGYFDLENRKVLSVVNPFLLPKV